MKKLLTFLAATAIIAPLSASLISCSIKGLDPESANPLMIGKYIDKSKAIDDSLENTKYGFTNFFVIGDSLSDTNGITNLIETKYKNPFFDIEVNLGGSYGFQNSEKEHVNAFSNGAPAAYLLSNELGFGNMDASNIKVKSGQEKYGKNYSVGGATAAKLSFPTGLLLNDATVDIQTEALLQQHQIKSTDLVFFEIGGNDLFSLVDLYKQPTKQKEFMTDSINRVRTAMFNLLNNGVENVIFMTPPKMDFVPRYQNVFKSNKDEDKAKAAYINNICEEYYKKLNEVIKEVQGYYPDSVLVYDLYNRAQELEDTFIESLAIPESGKRKIAYANTYKIDVKLDGFQREYYLDINNDLTSSVLEIFENLMNSVNFLETKKISLTINSNRSTDDYIPIDNYFFNDMVHPTKHVHEIVSKILLGYAEELSKKWKN